MSDQLNVDQLKALVGGTITLVVPEGTFTATLRDVTVVDVPAQPDKPAHQVLRLYHDWFIDPAETLRGLIVAEPNPLTYWTPQLDWQWQQGRFIGMFGVSETITIAQPSRG